MAPDAQRAADRRGGGIGGQAFDEAERGVVAPENLHGPVGAGGRGDERGGRESDGEAAHQSSFASCSFATSGVNGRYLASAWIAA